MDELLVNIDQSIKRKYEDVKYQNHIISGIEEISRQVRFRYPELAEHIKKRMLEIAREKGDLP